MKNTVFAKNRKANLEYEILKTYEAGIVLTGNEVKSIQTNNLSLAGSQVRLKNGRAYLVGANIALYQPNNNPEKTSPVRDRELLLNKKELVEIATKTTADKLTIVPISVYNKNYTVKLSFALARRKNKADKRASLHKKEASRRIKRVTG